MFTTLRRGSKGSDVLELQKLLNSKLVPSPGLKEDGEFGINTFNAVCDFQRLAGQTTSGVVSFWTWTRLYVKRVLSSTSCIRRPLPERLPDSSISNVTSTTTGNVSKAEKDAAPWMEYVIKEMEKGVTRIKGKGDDPRILEYFTATNLGHPHCDSDDTAWCSGFANWIMKKAGYRRTNCATALSWRDDKWGGKRLEEPRYGAITVIFRKAAKGKQIIRHVSFFVRQTSTSIYLLGGNQTKVCINPSTKKKIAVSTIKESGYSKAAGLEVTYLWPTEKK